jgi:hypothetical protein
MVLGEADFGGFTSCSTVAERMPQEFLTFKLDLSKLPVAYHSAIQSHINCANR